MPSLFEILKQQELQQPQAALPPILPPSGVPGMGGPPSQMHPAGELAQVADNSALGNNVNQDQARRYMQGAQQAQQQSTGDKLWNLLTTGNIAQAQEKPKR